MNQTPTNSLHAAALEWHHHGFAVIPTANDGTKRPAINWKHYQAERPDEAQLHAWFTSGSYDGLGIICGTPSGNLEMLEVEGRAIDLVPQLAGLLTDHDLDELWARLSAGYLEQSPSGGLHWLYRVSDGPARPNTKLARRPGDVANTVDVLIETRGEGGFTVAAPSAGRTHPTGKPWTTLAGNPATIPTITSIERDTLHAIANLLDTMPAAPTWTPAPTTSSTPGTRPGDDYNNRATWDDILGPLGWTKVKRIGQGYGWVRPGKNARDGISATTGTSSDGADRLYVFTTSTEFDTERPYNKFSAYTLIHHHGDYAAAAKALAAQGYGTPDEPARLNYNDLVAPQPTHPTTATAIPGRLQLVHSTNTPIDGTAALAPTPRATLAHSDDANALLLAASYGDLLRYCTDRGRWYAWNGNVWEECPRSAGPAREYAKEIARSLPENDKKDIDHKKRTLSAIGISAMLTQAASIPAFAVSYNELDAHPWELNTPGGIVDLRTGTISPPDPTHLHTRITTVTPDFTADRTVWTNFLATTFNGDHTLITYLQRLVGYSAIGVVGAHVLPYCHGSGGNGKGVFLEACVKVLGDYATTAPSGFLMAKNYAAHETEIARLAGARMVLCSEVNDEDRFDEARVKLLTGGDTLTARFMQQDHFTFTPTHQLWAMGNHQPHVRSGGRSFWRRLRLIPFTHEVPAEQIIDDLQGILATQHGPAVLAWIIEGAVAYHQHGLQEPETVRAATGEYQLDQDTVARFVEEMCHVGGGDAVQLKVGIVRAAYEAWCHEAGDTPVSAKSFGVALRRHGVETKRTNSARMYTNITLLHGEDDDNNASPRGAADDQGWGR